MLGVDQIDDYYDEIEELNNEIAKEKDTEKQNILRDRSREIVDILNKDKEDKHFYF